VLDLRFADGTDLAAAKAAAALFAARKQPLAILVNGETRGRRQNLQRTCATNARIGLRQRGAGLEAGHHVTVNAQDERALFKNPYEAMAVSGRMPSRPRTVFPVH